MSKMEMKTIPAVIGVDLGGSKILTAVVANGGRILSSHRCPTKASQDLNAVINGIIESVRQVEEKAKDSSGQIDAIGLGVPGVSNPETGILHASPNLPNCLNVPIQDIIEKSTSKKHSSTTMPMRQF